MRIIFATTCKGRLEHVQQTIPQNTADNPEATFLLLAYNDPELGEFIREHYQPEIASGRLVFYQMKLNVPFSMSHAKNLAARCAMLENSEILVTLDADNFAGKNFTSFADGRMDSPGVFLCPDFPRIKSLPHGKGRPQRGYAGRLAIRAQEFIKLGGYNETFDTWRGEDIDLIARLQKTGYEMRLIPNHFLNAIPHDAEVRFKEYPHAQVFETQGEWKKIYETKDTVVNYGKIGCGTVYRNFSDVPTVIEPIPTRLFGIGMQKTATTSLHAAFKILSFDSFHWDSNHKAWQIWNEMKTLGRSTLLEKSYALCDNPIPMLYRELDSAYPGSKFILTVRDEAGWLKSVEALFDPQRNPYYDWHEQPYSHLMHYDLYGRMDFDAATFLSRYRRHNAEVIEYFKDRPNDLLVMDMSNGSGWKQLCGFLKVPIPSVDYPTKFKTK